MAFMLIPNACYYTIVTKLKKKKKSYVNYKVLEWYRTLARAL